MATISNIHYNLVAWQANHVYSVIGVRVSNAGNAYQVIRAGTSAASGGPTTTAASIPDNTVTWKFLSIIDFTTTQNWLNSQFNVNIPSDMIGWLWNNGEIKELMGPGNSWFFTTPFTAANAHIRLTTAPGESFVDAMAANSLIPLTYDANNGVAVNFSTSNVSGVNLVWSIQPYVDISKIQFKSSNTTDQNRILVVDPSSQNCTFSQLIVDGVCQIGDMNVFASPNVSMTNCLIVDRQANNAVSAAVVSVNNAGTTMKIVNCTFVSVNNPSGIFTFFNNGVSAAGSFLFRNNIYMNQPTGMAGSTAAAVLIDHCITNQTSFGSNVTDVTGNLFSKAIANQFVSTTNNFKLKLGSDALDVGSTDPGSVAGSIDIIGTLRPQGTAWDIGAFEFLVNIPLQTIPLRFLMFT